MLDLNPTTFAAVCEKAAHDAANHARWLTAIGRAILELDSNPYIERSDHGLLIGSPSGGCYAANGVCQCTSYTGIDATGKRVHAGKKPCWHRAAARIVRLCDEREAAQRQIVCQQPDNLCELHNPCPEHAPAAAAYLQQNYPNRPLMAAYDAETERLAAKGEMRAQLEELQLKRKIAAARATAQLNELFA